MMMMKATTIEVRSLPNQDRARVVMAESAVNCAFKISKARKPHKARQEVRKPSCKNQERRPVRRPHRPSRLSTFNPRPLKRRKKTQSRRKKIRRGKLRSPRRSHRRRSFRRRSRRRHPRESSLTNSHRKERKSSRMYRRFSSPVFTIFFVSDARLFRCLSKLLRVCSDATVDE